MKMASSSFLGIVLTVAMFSAGAVVDRVTNVYVTNFPLDPQGNIRVAEMKPQENITIANLPLDEQENLRVKVAEKPTSLTINVTLNQPFTVVVGQEKLLGEVNVDGWKFAGVYVYWSTPPTKEFVYYMSFRTSSIPQMRVIYCGTQRSAGQQASYMENIVQGPILDIWINANGIVGETFQANVTISLYLTR